MKRKIATLGETDITVHPAAGILLLLGLLTRWRALLICTYASILLHETAHAALSALWHHPPQEVEITPLGAMMRLEDEERLPLTARISVILAGPLMTLILCALSPWLTQNGVIPREAGRLIFLSNAGILLVNLLARAAAGRRTAAVSGLAAPPAAGNVLAGDAHHRHGGGGTACRRRRGRRGAQVAGQLVAGGSGLLPTI